jgi:hypothetical protein
VGRLKLGRMNIEYKYVYIAAAAAGVILVALLTWYLTSERLPGYNTDPVFKQSYVEPDGKTSEYLTGIITMTEMSIIGPKMTVKMDVNNSDRTFYVPVRAPIWLGLVIGNKDITGREKIAFKDLKKGWRVAVFIDPRNRATRINVIERSNAQN